MFTRATKTRAKGRLALIGPPGSGKTYTALVIAGHLGKKVAVIDTEHGSASKYADIFDFDVTELSSFSPDIYVQKIREAEAAGYDVLIIDSLSHAWAGKDGALEMVDQVTARSKSRNSFTAWREVTPHHNAMVEAILAVRCHVIVTMRSKVEYVVEDDGRGRKVPRKVGMAPIQRDGLEYEFDVVGDMDHENTLVITKSRCPDLSGLVVKKPGESFAKTFLKWLSDGQEAKSIPPDQSDHVTPQGTQRAAAGPNPKAEFWMAFKQRYIACSGGCELPEDTTTQEISSMISSLCASPEAAKTANLNGKTPYWSCTEKSAQMAPDDPAWATLTQAIENINIVDLLDKAKDSLKGATHAV